MHVTLATVPIIRNARHVCYVDFFQTRVQNEKQTCFDNGDCKSDGSEPTVSLIGSCRYNGRSEDMLELPVLTRSGKVYEITECIKFS